MGTESAGGDARQKAGPSPLASLRARMTQCEGVVGGECRGGAGQKQVLRCAQDDSRVIGEVDEIQTAHLAMRRSHENQLSAVSR